jgi:hypothetical protein
VIRADLDQLVPDLQSATFEEICDRWEVIEDEFGDAGKAWLGKNDRFYLLTRILGRIDAIHPWLYARCREVEADPDGYLDLWAREHYKAESLETPIATPNGWARFGDLRPGSWVFGPDGMPTRVIAQTPVFEKPDCYEVVFDDGARCKVSGAHLWTVEQITRKRIPGAYKKDGPKRQYRETVTLATSEMARHDHRQDNRLAIPITLPLAMPDALLPIEPYTLGAWLGDGSSADGRITGVDIEVFQAIEAEGYRVGADIAPSKPNAVMRTVYGLRPMLRGLGILGDKHIPICYQRGSVGQRMELLRGLMDTDGHCNTRGTATFTNISRRLTDDVFDLAAGLGLKPMRYELQNEHGPVWQIAFQAYQEFNPFKLPRKAQRAKTGARPNPRRYVVDVKAIGSEPMRCIQVDRPDGLYLTGRHLVTTHNSTIITFAGIIQEIIRNPDITIGIFSHTKPIARKFLGQIKKELESNACLAQTYPDIFYADPKRQAPQWSEEKGLIVKRKSNPKEATLEAHGLVDGQPTGAHFMLRVYDDVVTLESVSTPEQVNKTTLAWELSDNLGARSEDGELRSWHVGTRYSFADTYQVIIDRKALKVRLHPATDNGLPEGNPVFLTPAAWADKKLKQSAATIACQQLMNPAAGNEAMFNKDWLKFIDIRPATLNVYIMVDPANSKKKESDNTAMAVVGVDAGSNRYLLDGYRHKMGLKERWEALRGLRRFWVAQPGVQMVKVGYEKYGMQSDLEYFELEMERDKDHFEIHELNWTSDGTKAKDDRVQRLQPDFKSGKFYLAAVCRRQVPLLDKDNKPVRNGKGEVVMVWEPYETSAQRSVREGGQSFRIFTPVKRRDHENNVYSLNQGFLEEFLTYPFSAKKDLIDATSRLYDMEPVPPVIVDEKMLEPETFADGA